MEAKGIGMLMLGSEGGWHQKDITLFCTGLVRTCGRTLPEIWFFGVKIALN